MKQLANCRSGPTTEYPLLSILPAGGQYEIRARNTPGDSWMVFDPAINGTCWVYGNMVEVIGDPSLVMIIDPAPPDLVLPTETTAPFNCAQFNSNTCTINNHPCQWSGGACVNK